MELEDTLVKVPLRKLSRVTQILERLRSVIKVGNTYDWQESKRILAVRSSSFGNAMRSAAYTICAECIACYLLITTTVSGSMDTSSWNVD